MCQSGRQLGGRIYYAVQTDPPVRLTTSLISGNFVQVIEGPPSGLARASVRRRTRGLQDEDLLWTPEADGDSGDDLLWTPEDEDVEDTASAGKVDTTSSTSSGDVVDLRGCFAAV